MGHRSAHGGLPLRGQPGRRVPGAPSRRVRRAALGRWLRRLQVARRSGASRRSCHASRMLGRPSYSRQPSAPVSGGVRMLTGKASDPLTSPWGHWVGAPLPLLPRSLPRGSGKGDLHPQGGGRSMQMFPHELGDDCAPLATVRLLRLTQREMASACEGGSALQCERHVGR